MKDDNRIIYFVEDLVDILKLSKDFVYSLFRRDDFPGMQIANRYCIRKDFFWIWLEQQENTTKEVPNEN